MQKSINSKPKLDRKSKKKPQRITIKQQNTHKNKRTIHTLQQKNKPKSTLTSLSLHNLNNHAISSHIPITNQITHQKYINTFNNNTNLSPKLFTKAKFTSTSTIPPPAQHPLIKTTISDPQLYSREADKVFEGIIHRLELPDIDYEYENDIDFSGDVLNLKTARGTWVLNKHNVTKQIWLSSPISGPSKYNYHPPNFSFDTDHTRIYAADAGHGGKWLSERDDTTQLSTLLKKEWSSIFDGKEMNFQHDF